MFQVMKQTTAPARQITRREMVQRLLVGMGAGAAWPLAAPSHPIHELLRNDAVLEEAEKLGSADWKPLFLDEQQNESLIAMAESIVPGSTKARVNRFIDLLLSVDTAEHRTNFVDSLSGLEAQSGKQFGKRFPALNSNDQNTILMKASSGGTDESNRDLHKHFENLKGWISGAYYSSEIGMKELGWTPDRVFASFPGCDHPEGHH